jgi:hypothetical protein
MKTILLTVKILMHCFHIEAKRVCIINRAQKTESQSPKYILTEKKEKGLEEDKFTPLEFSSTSTKGSEDLEGR